MGKKKKRVDRSEAGSKADENPFSALADLFPGGEKSAAGPVKEPMGDGAPYKVGRTRKGGWDLTLERRGPGKKVTVLRRVSGDCESLLTKLKRRCGTGGTLREGEIELQGDHREAVRAFLEG